MSLIQNYDEQVAREQAAKDGITHISTGVAVVRNGKLLMVRRVPNDTYGAQFELPGGGVDAGETIEHGAIRELKEETNLIVKRVMAVFDGFDYSTAKKPKVRQFNFLVEVAEPIDIKLDPNEHDDVRWINAEDINLIDMSQSMQVCVSELLKIIGVEFLQ